MTVVRDGNITIITQKKASVKTLVNIIEQAYDKYRSYHLMNYPDAERSRYQEERDFFN